MLDKLEKTYQLLAALKTAVRAAANAAGLAGSLIL
jgi:hypothetical protein